MDFKKRIIEELNIIGDEQYKDLYQNYIDVCEKLAKEYHNEQLLMHSVSNSEACSKCDGYGYTIDENGRRKEHCDKC